MHWGKWQVGLLAGVLGLAWLLAFMLIGEKIYPDNDVAAYSFGLAGLSVGIYIGFSLGDLIKKFNE